MSAMKDISIAEGGIVFGFMITDISNSLIGMDFGFFCFDIYIAGNTGFILTLGLASCLRDFTDLGQIKEYISLVRIVTYPSLNNTSEVGAHDSVRPLLLSWYSICCRRTYEPCVPTFEEISST